jgi:hypothetical protein
MNFTNNNVVIILIIIIVFVFIYNFDVYVITKNEPICKPIYVTKKIINDEMKQVSQLEKKINQEFSNFKEDFDNLSCNLNIPDNSLTNFNVNGIKSSFKKSVIESVISVLANIPTDMSDEHIKEIIEYFSIIYETSLNIHDFYNNVSNSTKINKDPYNTKYAHLVLYLINKFDNDYSCLDNLSLDKNNNLKETHSSNLQDTLSSNLQGTSPSNLQKLRSSNLQGTSPSNLQGPSPSNLQYTPPSNLQYTPPSNLQGTSPSNLQYTPPSNLQGTSPSNLQYTPPSNLPPFNLINQMRMIQQENIMNAKNQAIPDETAPLKNNEKTENIKDMINKLSAVSSEVSKKCKIIKSNNKLNNPRIENFNNIDTYNNAFMENLASF